MSKACIYLKNHVQENTSFGNVVANILWLGSFFSSISFTHVRRQDNIIAHTLDHNGREYGCMRVWLEEVSLDALPFVLTYLSLMND